MVPSVLGSQITFAVIVAWGLQRLKQASWFPWLTAEKVQIVRAVSIVVAAAGTLGIHVAWQHDIGTLTITGLTWATVGPSLWHVIQQYVFQEMSYHAVVKPAMPNPVPAPAPAVKT